MQIYLHLFYSIRLTCTLFDLVLWHPVIRVSFCGHEPEARTLIPRYRNRFHDLMVNIIFHDKLAVGGGIIADCSLRFIVEFSIISETGSQRLV